MTGYELIKALHIATVVTTFVLFVVRAGWILRRGRHTRPRWMRWLPHVNDILLLTFGIWMTVLASLNPLTHPWLLAKLIALVVYILLGMAALKWAATRRGRITALVLALLVFGYMVGVAMSKQAGWMFSFL